MSETVVISGSAGFIGGYVVQELLDQGYRVVGIDNFSKYGKVARSYDDHPEYRLVEADVQDVDLMTELLMEADHFIAGAAMIGGISYFHSYAYDLLATNERIIASSCDAAITAHQDGKLTKVTFMSSSMVFESAQDWPSYEGQERKIPPVNCEAALRDEIPFVRGTSSFVRQWRGAGWLKKTRPVNPGFDRIRETAEPPDSYALVRKVKESGTFCEVPEGYVELGEMELLDDEELPGDAADELPSSQD